MSRELFNYLSDYIDLNEEEISALSELDIIKNYPKGTLLLREGEIRTGLTLCSKDV